MQAKKRVIANLTKCYSVAPLFWQNKKYFLVAAEKQDPCYLFDMEGNLADTVWEGPGGVMSMVQAPGSDGIFLATQKFYSPNDSKEARIVTVKPDGKGSWQTRTLVSLPHVHRFDILERNGVQYLLACTLKSGHGYKDDWTVPGKIYGGVLPENLDSFDEKNPLPLTVIRENLLKNHGYYKVVEGGVERGLVSSEDGIFLVTPPEAEKDGWEIKKLTEEPASDAVLVDLDGDGEKELVFISHFHGDKICVLKEGRRVFSYKDAEFAHAIYGGTLLGKPVVIVGHRGGSKELLVFSYDRKTGSYCTEALDHGCGPANVYKFVENGRELLVAANREKDEIAMYTDFTEDTGK